jgi:hypothetical protein
MKVVQLTIFSIEGKAIGLLLMALLVLFTTSTLPAQSLRGKVLDAEGNPIPYCAIAISGHSTGTISNINGDFFFEETPPYPFTIEVSNVSFRAEEIVVANDTVLTVELDDRVISLDTLVIHSALKNRQLGAPDKCKGSTLYKVEAPFHQIGVVLNDHKAVGALLTAVSVSVYQGMFYPIKPDGRSKLRLRVYSVDNDGKVLDDLLPESIIAAPDSKGWQKIDISKFKIEFPSNGLAVAFEWLDDSPVYHTRTKKSEYVVDFGIGMEGHSLQRKPVESDIAIIYYNPYTARWGYEVSPQTSPGIQLEVLD